MGAEEKRIMIGVCGGTGSGKTTLARRIYDALGGDALLLNMDCYYKDHKEMPYEERCKLNYDCPSAFDGELLVSHLKALKRGEPIVYPTYDFTRHLRADETVYAESKRVIIIEGILLFDFPEIVNLLDMKIFVDTDADVRILRRLVRDVSERGRSIDSVVSQYLNTVKPMHEKYIEPTKRLADVIVPEGGQNDVAYEMIVNSVLKKISR